MEDGVEGFYPIRENSFFTIPARTGHVRGGEQKSFRFSWRGLLDRRDSPFRFFNVEDVIEEKKKFAKFGREKNLAILINTLIVDRRIMDRTMSYVLYMYNSRRNDEVHSANSRIKLMSQVRQRRRNLIQPITKRHNVNRYTHSYESYLMNSILFSLIRSASSSSFRERRGKLIFPNCNFVIFKIFFLKLYENSNISSRQFLNLS